MRGRMLGLALALTAGTTAGADELREAAGYLFAPLPSTIPAVRDNRITPAKIELGKALFFDPRLSASGVFSCSSCHNLATGGDDNLETSIGHGWQKGPRNTPTVLNAVLNEAQFWDGRAEDLKAQVKVPMTPGAQMSNTPENVVNTLNSMPGYVEWFGVAFPDDAEPVNFNNMAKALEAFEATLITPAPFDAWLNGDDEALSDEAKAGLTLFIERGCASCHRGVNVGGHGYYPFGLVENPGAELLPADDKGRFAVTSTEIDEYFFRAAPLRNVAVTAPYFHSGKVWDLKVAVEVMAGAQLGEELTGDEADRIVAFLQSLTGAMPPVIIPVLPSETSSTPRPATVRPAE